MEPNPTSLPQSEPEPQDPPAMPGQVIGPGSSSATASTPDASSGLPQPTQPPPQPDRPIAVAGVPPSNDTILPPTTGPVIGANDQNLSSTKKPIFKRLSSKATILATVAGLLLVGGSAGAYFGYYVPNKPENIWAKALSNTGKGYDKLSNYTQQQFNSSNKTLKVDGTFKVTGLVTADGDLKGSSGSGNSEFTGDISTQGVKVSLDLRTIKSTGDTPDLYFKLDGLQGLGTILGPGASPYISAIDAVNGNWYVVDHSLFDQYAGSATSMQFSQADVKALLDAVGNASKQNVFTSNQTKMTFKIEKKVGREEQDGRSVYHYVIAVDKTNLKNYVTALCNNLKNTKLKSLIDGDNANLFTAALSCSNLEASVGSYKGDGTFDAWVDTRTKLIHKIRIVDSADKNTYFDIGQDYQGGDDIPFSVAGYSTYSGLTTSVNLSVDLNTKTNVVTIKGTIHDSGNDSNSGLLNLTISRTNDKVNVQKPAGAKTLTELINNLGLGDLLGGATIGPSAAADAERKTDINAVHSQLEAYFAINGKYPSLAEMNNPSWRAQYLQSLDPAALADPKNAGSQKLCAALTSSCYSYVTAPAGCDNAAGGDCTSYNLTATLDGGGTYVKQSLN